MAYGGIHKYMDAAAKLGRNTVSKHQIHPMSRLTRDGTAEPVSRDQTLRHKREQGNIQFPCSADHVQDWQPYPVDPYHCYVCSHTTSRALSFGNLILDTSVGGSFSRV